VNRAIRFVLLPVLFAVSGLSSCKCGGDRQTFTVGPCEGVANVEPGNVQACSADADCHEQFPCTSVKDRESLMCCVATSRKCTKESDCCAGQQCPSSQGRCVDKFDNCVDDTSCGTDGRVCLPYQDLLGNTGKRCQFKKCSALGECEPGLSCFQGECLAGLPCGGACEEGKACLAKANHCQEFSCPASCAPGFIRTFKEPDAAWNYCKKEQTVCECSELPGISSKDLGRFSAIAADPSTGDLWVSAYDGQYGDLVVTRFNELGKQTKQEYIDGVPGGNATWGPSGARGGIEAAGPDVGRYSDIGFFGARAYVSYYDATNGDLKLAKRAPDETWSTLTVDGSTGDVGLYSSLAIDSDGFPAIAYFQRAGSPSFDPATCPTPVPTGDKANMTALKLAKAKNQNPGAADFTITVLACMTRTPSTTALQEVQDGVGLFPSLAFKGKDAYVAFMRRSAQGGNLQGIVLTGTGTKTGPSTFASLGDVGYFPDVEIKPDNGQVWVSFFDASTGGLQLYKGAAFTGGTTSVVDPGNGGPGSGDVSLVGADSAIGFTATNQAVIVYQDSTKSDLKIAVAKGGGWEKLQPIRAEGAVGFFADIVFSKNYFFVSHARLGTKSVSGNPTIANSMLIEKVSLP
jgi:hypothetical protein